MADNQEVYLFNTLTRRKEIFVSLKKGVVKMYTCGPTVYDFAHIGNFRAFIFEDLLRRWFEYMGHIVIQVMNLTDVDDKTIRAAMKKDISLDKYTNYYIQAFFEDISTLNIKKASYYPKATEHIPEMLTLIKRLIEKGSAYQGEDGSIYYRIASFKGYGKLSKMKFEALKTSERVKRDEYGKEEAQDFALWKSWSKEDGKAFWDSEFGKGRPGWHIECSAMSMKYLGETFDIHCGGVDNIFPHHENEIAQSEAATGKKFANYWLHNDFLLVEGKKMAKKLGNFYTLRDLLAKGYDPKAIRYLLMSTHYRQQLNFTFSGLEAAKSAVDRLVNLTYRLVKTDGQECGEKISALMKNLKTKFEMAMNDDLNISVSLASVFDFVRDVNKLIDEGKLSKREAQKVYDLVYKLDNVLGVLGPVPKKTVLSPEAIELIRQREEARRLKDWETADKLRNKLKAMGVILEDNPQGVTWRLEK